MGLIARTVFSLLGCLAWTCAAGSSPATYEIWDLPEGGLVCLDVPDTVAGEGTLEVAFDGTPVLAQEIRGAGGCIVRPTPEQRAKSRTDAIRVSLRRRAGTALPAPRTGALVVTNAAFCLTFDGTRRGGLPSRVVWASGKQVDNLAWGDRVFADGRTAFLQGDPSGEVLDYGEGPLFRQVRTVSAFTAGKKPCDGHPRADYDWLFFNGEPEWVGLWMNFSSEGRETWSQLQAGILEFPFAAFATGVADAGRDPVVKPLPRNGKSDRPTGRAWTAFLAGSDFAAVYSTDNCGYTDPNRKVDYLHASNRQSYALPWSGERHRRRAFFRFASAADPVRALKAEPPVRQIGGQRRLDRTDDVDACRPGEAVACCRSGTMEIRVGVQDGTRAHLKSVRVDGRVVAAGPQPLFTAHVEDVETGRLIAVASGDDWRTVETRDADVGRVWHFAGPKAHPELAALEVTVKAMPSEDGTGIDWSFEGKTGSAGHALAKAAVGALTFLSTGRTMRALYPDCMGLVSDDPCSDTCRHNGSYPSMHCVMPWEAVWDERSGRGFYVGAQDPAGGAKLIGLQGNSMESTVRIELTHRLAWDGRHPEAASRMSGVIAWRPFAGDWYEAALLYRDWAREHAAWYPRMGPEGRVSTPDWFKDLGFIVRTYGFASNAVADVKTCQDYLGVPVMAHWYVWHRQPFDNDYPHYFPAKPGFEEGVREIHAKGGYAVPYTNGHLWDLHDRGVEDWKFTREGAYGACRKADGSIYTEKYRSVETNGTPVTFAAMCPASRVWHDKVGDNCHKVVNVAGLDGYYMDQVGAFSTIDCRNPEHGHPFGGGSWWQEGYRRLLADARARCTKKVFFGTEGNAEHTFDQIDAFVCWNIPGGVDTVPAFEVCYSGAVTVYCRSYGSPSRDARQMRMKFANTLADGEQFGWLPATYCTAPEINGYLRTCVRFRHANAAWFTRAEMRRPPRLAGDVPRWDETWDIFGKKRPATMPIVQTGARRMLDYDYAPDGRRLWKTGRVKKAFVYFTNFSPDESVTARVTVDWADLGIDPTRAVLTRVDAEGTRSVLATEELERPFVFAPGCCFGIEAEPSTR